MSPYARLIELNQKVAQLPKNADCIPRYREVLAEHRRLRAEYLRELEKPQTWRDAA